MPESNAQRVVLAPDLVGAGLIDAAAAEVLRRWRDGKLRPVVNRSLVIRYFKLMRNLGLPDLLIRRWGWWLGSEDKVLFLPEMAGSPARCRELCETLARAGQAERILCYERRASQLSTEPSGEGTGAWITAEEWLTGKV